jgi:hypothetical protein
MSELVPRSSITTLEISTPAGRLTFTLRPQDIATEDGLEIIIKPRLNPNALTFAIGPQHIPHIRIEIVNCHSRWVRFFAQIPTAIEPHVEICNHHGLLRFSSSDRRRRDGKPHSVSG